MKGLMLKGCVHHCFSGDFVEIPRGYHPFHAAPGYDNYYLWIMAGKDRGFYMTTDEEHKWLNN